MNKNLLIFLSFAALITLSNLGSWGLTESSEARYAEISKEMMDNNDWVNPTLLNIKHFHKPPVTYYLTILGYKIWGQNEFGARFFMQIALLLQLLLVYQLGKSLFKDKKWALSASMIYFALPLTIISVRNLTTDAFLNTFILASIYFWIQYNEKHKSYFLILFYTSLGLIFETKGPVGFVLPLVFILSYKISQKQKIKMNLSQVLGFLVFLGISASWYIAVQIKNPHLLDYFINHQLVDRVASDSFSRAKPFWYYFAFTPLLAFPWIFIFLFKGKQTVLKMWNKNSYEKALIIACGVFFFILSLSASKLPLYILPIFPFIALFSARLLQESKQNFTWPIYGFILVFSIAIITVALIDISIKISLPKALIIGLSGIIISSWIKFKMGNLGKAQNLVLGLVNISLIIISSLVIFNANESELNSPKPMAKFIKELDSSKTKNVLVFNELLPSLKFYLNRDIITVNNGKYTTEREIQFETNKNYQEYLINYKTENERFESLLNTPNSVLIIKTKNKLLPSLSSGFNASERFGKFTVFYNK
ncbi:MAG: ArnT family glycosyltransferase [Flavobacteriaceae bacterium]